MIFKQNGLGMTESRMTGNCHLRFGGQGLKALTPTHVFNWCFRFYCLGAPHGAHEEGAKKSSCLVTGHWKGKLLWLFLKIFIVKDMVAKQLSKGRLFTESHNSVKLPDSILVTRHSPIQIRYRDNYMKARMLGSCATVQEASIAPSICNKNNSHTCGELNQTLLQLNVKILINHWKSIAVPTYSDFLFRRWSHVMPKSLIGFRTRSSEKSRNMLKVYGSFKGAGLLVRNFMTDCSQGNQAEVVQLLADLKANSIKNNINGVNNCVNSLLGKKEFWVLCYESIKSNPGTQSFGGSFLLKHNEKPKTLDGITLDFFSKLSASILSGKFKFGPTRRIEISKPQGGSRPIGIADSTDKIVQKGIAIILECVSEHKFLDCSFGFRRGRSCQDALFYIRKKVPSGLWAIEGDISKCFDSFEHKRLASLIRKKYVSNQVFIDLIYKALKVKIIRFNSSFINKIGTAQGSLVSPILCNIYLHELDVFITENAVLAKYRKGKAVSRNHKFTTLLKPTKDELIMGENIRKAKGKLKMWKYFHKLRVSKLKLAKSLKIQRNKFTGNNRKYAYIRYADDFIIFVWGTKNDCLEIKLLIKNFLIGDLGLNLSNDKTKITYLKKEKAEFLGFQIWQSPSILPAIKKDVNPIGKIDREKMNSKFRAATMQIPRLRITFSMEKILRKLVDKGLLRFKGGKFFPTSYKPALQYDIPNIVNYIKSVFRGICNYYGFAHNWYDAKSIYNYFGRYCAAMTIAHKTKSKVPKVFNKYGNNLSIIGNENKVIAKFDILSNKTFKNNVNNNFVSFTSNVDDLLLENLKIAKQHLIKWNCVICGDDAEMHHIKHVRKV
jgi:group II intron reverse transcriptase/maturase